MGSCVTCKKTTITTFPSTRNTIKFSNNKKITTISKLISLLPVNESHFMDSNSKYDNPDNYMEVEAVGRGSHGKVTKMKHKMSDQLLIEKSENGVDSIKFMENEARILRKLHHPKICRLKRVCKKERINSLILEYYPDQTLQHLLEKTKLDEQSCVQIVHQMLEILIYMHQKGVFHRDIKPDNVLVEQGNKGDLDVKLIDFGVACFADDPEDQFKQFGNPHYFAPERRKGINTEKGDIWSLGVMLYYMMFLSFPYPEHPIEFNEVNFENFDDCSEELKDLLGKMLQVNHKTRPEASKLLKHPWFLSFSKETLIRKKLISVSHVTKSKAFDQFRSDSLTSAEIHKYNMGFLRGIMNCLVNYEPGNKLQQNVIALIVHNMGYSDEKRERINVFNIIDSKSKGRLDIEDLRKAMLWAYDKVTVEYNLEILFKRMDRNNSQYIEMDEFLQATFPKDKLLSPEVMKDVYYFLCGGTNGIDKKILAEKFNIGENIISRMWTKFVEKHDANKDGLLSFEEFSLLMKGMISEN